MSAAADDDGMVVDQQGQGQEDGEEAPRSGMCTMIGWELGAGGGYFRCMSVFPRANGMPVKPLGIAESRRR